MKVSANDRRQRTNGRRLNEDRRFGGSQSDSGALCERITTGIQTNATVAHFAEFRIGPNQTLYIIRTCLIPASVHRNDAGAGMAGDEKRQDTVIGKLERNYSSATHSNGVRKCDALPTNAAKHAM
jgi:hypothetical protein